MAAAGSVPSTSTQRCRRQPPPPARAAELREHSEGTWTSHVLQQRRKRSAVQPRSSAILAPSRERLGGGLVGPASFIASSWVPPRVPVGTGPAGRWQAAGPGQQRREQRRRPLPMLL